jgi:prepilin-type N-terminal cleavage/methylation domain-containing protein
MTSAPTRSCRRRRATRRAGPTRARYGFTLIEVLVAAAIIVILMGLLFGVLSRVRGAQRSVKCISTLRNLANSFHQYAQDHGGRFPDPGRSNRSWEQMLLRYYRGSFACDADNVLFPAVGSSYDWRDTGNPATTLAGRSIQEVARNDAVLVFEALPGWHARRKINVARVDGSASPMDDDACFRDLQRPLTNQPGPGPES